MVGEETSRSRKGDFELRHWRSSSSSSSSEKKKQPSLRRRATAVLPAIEIPNGGGGGGSGLESGSFGSDRGYTSLRDILSSPRYSSASAADSPIGAGGGGGGGGGNCAEIRISNPLVKQAAYAYLQPTPSMREPSRRRRSRICRLLLALACCCSGGAGRGGAATLFGPCFDFLGRLFGR